MFDEKATRRDCHHDRASVRRQEDAKSISNHGALLMGLSTACAFGCCLLHWALF